MKRKYLPFINYFRTLEEAQDYVSLALEEFEDNIRKLRVSKNTTSHYRENFHYIVILEVYTYEDWEV